MSVSSFIARRYFAGRKRMFASFLSAIAVLGVALGVFSLVVVMSVMSGFSRDLQKRLIGFSAHLVIEPLNDRNADFGPMLKLFADKVESNAVVIEGEGIVEVKGSNGETAQGVKIRGMDKEDYSKLKGVDFYYSEIAQSHDRTIALLGNELAYELGVHPDYGDVITLIVPIGRVGPTGDILPEKMSFTVGGMFRSGYFDHDSKTIIISKEFAKKLFGERAIPSLHVWLKDLNDADGVISLIKKNFPDTRVFSWMTANKKLFSALKLERIAMTVLLTLTIMIACISILSVIFMYVFLRRKDIAILISVGATRGQIKSIFIKIGAYIGIGGTILGMAGGLLACWYIKTHKIILPDSYFLNQLPVYVSWPFLFAVMLCGVGISVLASIYPSSQAGKLDPQELLRYE